MEGTNEGNGRVGIVKITGGHMPVYVALLGIQYDNTYRLQIMNPSGSQVTTTFNKAALPGGGGGGPTAYTLALAKTGGGNVTASPPGAAYAPGTRVTLTATPAAGYTFSGWTVDGAAAGSANPFTLTIDAPHTVVANFAPAAPPAPPTRWARR